MAVMASKSLTVVILATGEKVSLKLMPYCCVNPLATSLALNHSIEPSALCLVLYTYLHPIVCFPIARSTNSPGSSLN